MFLPFFNRGSILKQNMLEALRDFPHSMLDAKYYEYGDGIISGFDVLPLEEHQFQIFPGLMKIKNKIFVLSEPMTIEQKSEKHYVYMTLQNNKNADGVDVLLNFEQLSDLNESEFELFRYTKNAEMFVYKDIFEVFNSPMNRINQIYCKYSVIGGNTLHPYYYRLFANEVLNSENASQCDIAFAFQCLNGINNIAIVKQYFEGAYSNVEVLNKMKFILNRLKKNNEVHENKPPRIETPKKMFIS